MTQIEVIDKVKELIERFDLSKNTRKIEYVFPRFYLMNHLRENTGLSLSRIGLLFNKDHSTVIHGIKTHCLIKSDRTYKRITEEVSSELNGTVLVMSLDEKEDIINEVLLCGSYWQMVKLQNKLKNLTKINI